MCGWFGVWFEFVFTSSICLFCINCRLNWFVCGLLGLLFRWSWILGGLVLVGLGGMDFVLGCVGWGFGIGECLGFWDLVVVCVLISCVFEVDGFFDFLWLLLH